MKKYLVILFIGVAGGATSQQVALNSQYLFNEMLVNPGATGTKDYIPVQLGFRKQWVNFPGSPTTQTISCHAAIAKNMGFGGTVFNDVSGPSRRTGMNISGSYQLRLDKRKEHSLGLGLGVSLTQHIIDVNQLITYLPDDPAVLRGYDNQLVPDANFGVFYKFKDKGFAGLSAYNLVELNRDLYDFENPIHNTLVRTYYFVGGYDFELSPTFDLKPTALVQTIETGTTQFDISLIGTYKKVVWLGASYRHTDAVVFMAGAQAGPFKFGYSYDYTLSDIGNYSSGSHEIFLEIQFYKEGSSVRTPWLKRNRIFSPRIK
ncbi:MAG: type IX secretion system membrane protein PorP/SprF [Crocinitomicaceae bacterium]|nr:type IX secretion system membrane protein PorP/SprF [Crocinitomicaceae bacterium]